MVPLSRFALSLLRRDPASAEEALRAAEALGRSSMDELRRTVGLLRSADEPGGVAPPLPSAGEVASLVEYAHSAGLAVELRTQGDIARIPPAVGVAVYRIAQESLANAARHAPRARTVLELELDAERPFIDPQKETPRQRQGAGSSINVCAASPSTEMVGARSRLRERDRPGHNHIAREAVHSDCRRRLEHLVALQLSGRELLADGDLDLSLGGHAQSLEELP